MEKTKVFLVRHGQTVDNVNQILQGQTHGMLTEEGRRQARNVSIQMKDEHIDAFISS
ncbi:MAG: histidine phosphatase family protein, partial [Prevotella sp.]|nr:histidine phosphatase family protein [Prevotella sp.]